MLTGAKVIPDSLPLVPLLTHYIGQRKDLLCIQYHLHGAVRVQETLTLPTPLVDNDAHSCCKQLAFHKKVLMGTEFWWTVVQDRHRTFLFSMQL